MTDLISKKQAKRLEFSSNDMGYYPGDSWDHADAQNEKLEKLGLVRRYYPPNQAHNSRVVITEAGRVALSKFKGSEK